MSPSTAMLAFCANIALPASELSAEPIWLAVGALPSAVTAASAALSAAISRSICGSQTLLIVLLWALVKRLLMTQVLNLLRRSVSRLILSCVTGSAATAFERPSYIFCRSAKMLLSTAGSSGGLRVFGSGSPVTAAAICALVGLLPRLLVRSVTFLMAWSVVLSAAISLLIVGIQVPVMVPVCAVVSLLLSDQRLSRSRRLVSVVTLSCKLLSAAIAAVLPLY